MTKRMGRRSFLEQSALMAGLAALSRSAAAENEARPNIILCMADDLGWGDVGYHDHPVLKTPHLDEMARQGIRMDRFYSAAPVCSPTRGSCLTGRHPFRYGVFGANKGRMPQEEKTLAEWLQDQGYLTGHFGKWHLGTLTKTEPDSNRGGPKGAAHYSPPWDNGFEVCFSTEAKVPTWDPMKDPKKDAPYGTYYWRGPQVKATENLEGDDSRVIMDRVIPFLRQAKSEERPFFAVVWFHSPHLPVVPGPDVAQRYPDQPDLEQAYYGCVSDLDAQVGRLRHNLDAMGMKENTMLWFCSDNGPEGQAKTAPGSAAPFRGRKRDLYEGGVRVPALFEWPARFPDPATVEAACSTSDYFPTILEALGAETAMPVKPVDGMSLLPVLDGEITQRPQPLCFEHRDSLAVNDARYKIVSTDAGKHWELYDLDQDPGEKRDIAASLPQEVKRLRAILETWRDSCTQSRTGDDYS